MVRLESEGYSVVLSYEEDGQTFVVREHLHGRSCETHLRAVCGRLISAMQSLYGRTRAMQRIENGDSKY